MSSDLATKDPAPKTTTAARVAISSGPAASSAEARKNKNKSKKRARKSLAHLPPSPPLLTGTEAHPTDLSLEIIPAPPQADAIMSTEDDPTPPEATYNLGHSAPQPIVPYPASDTSAAPSPMEADPFLGTNSPSPSPPQSPSPQRTPKSSAIIGNHPADTYNDVLMEDPSTIPTGCTPLATTPKATGPPRPLTISRSEGSIPISRARPALLGLRSSIQARLEAAAERQAATLPAHRGPPREPIDKYTNAVMPTVQDADPTATLNHIDQKFAIGWGRYPGGKLLAIPFDEGVLNMSLHNIIKGKILTAVTEITQTSEIGVSPPLQSKDAERDGQTPIAFLVYSLTEAQCELLLQRKVWSSTAITFRVTRFNAPCPDYLFTIAGISTGVPGIIFDTVKAVWQDDDTRAFANSITEAFPEELQPEIRSSIQAFLNALRVEYLNHKITGNTLNPMYNVFAGGAEIPDDDMWVNLRDYLASRAYITPVQDHGTTSIAPIDCSLCQGVNHPRGLCPFPDVPGWNGPGTNSPTSDQRDRGGRPRGFSTRGTRGSGNRRGNARGRR